MNLIRNHAKRLYVFIPVLSIFLLIAVYFGVRGIVLTKAISSINSRISNHHYTTRWDEARFRGVNTVFVRGLNIRSQSGDIRVDIDSVSVRIRIFPLITGNVRIRRIDCRAIDFMYDPVNGIVQDQQELPADTTNIMDFLSGKDLADFAYRNIRRFFNMVPDKLHFGKTEARITYAGNTTVIALHDLHLGNGRFGAELILTGDDSVVHMPFTGRLDNSSSIIELQITGNDTGLFPVPFLRDRFGVATGFDSLNFLVDLSRRDREMINIAGEFNFSGFELNGERLSTENIVINRFQSDFHINIGSNSMEIDSVTRIYLNRIVLKPFLKISFSGGPDIEFKILPQTWHADDFFSSLPRGMFTSIIGTKATGFLDFFLDFSANFDIPDSLRFNIGFKARDLDIISFGTDNYNIINSGFIHRVFDHKGRQLTSFPVGPENPDFVAFNDISPYLRASVMTSEDGSFFYHNGFNPNAFRESISTNIKEGRFARGGSTISMQLVKNVFLTRNKTLARKIEEALIVWLIESRNLVSKQRMYEVYLNIIEWGPGIYGIGQASRFYFGKTPSELSLEESVFLASIVPRPRWYKYTFEENGRPKPFFSAYFNRLKDLMVQKEFISPSDTIGVLPHVTLTGSAASATSNLKF